MTVVAQYEKEGSRHRVLLPDDLSVEQVRMILENASPSIEFYFDGPLPRYLCRAVAPHNPDMHGKWAIHQSAFEIGDFGDTRAMKCADCGQEWEEELPQ